MSKDQKPNTSKANEAEDKDQAPAPTGADNLTPPPASGEAVQPEAVTTVLSEAVPTHDHDGLDELPEGAVLAADIALVGDEDRDHRKAAPITEQAPTVSDFSDDHVGTGGSYAIGEDGVRRPLYEAYQTPAPGKAGEKGDMVTKYRRVM